MKDIIMIENLINTMFPFAKKETFPSYNIIALNKTDSVFEISVPGFKKSELNLVHNSHTITITGRKSKPIVANYLYKGIETNTIYGTYTIGSDSIVERADYTDGILSVYVSSKQLVQDINIDVAIGSSERDYLTERTDIV